MTVMAAKILLSPLCVIGVSLAGRRWGMGVAGVLGGLPVVAGPILLVETLLHGPAFGADAAASTLLALAALTAFVVVYGRAAGKVGAIACVLCDSCHPHRGLSQLALRCRDGTCLREREPRSS